MAQLTLTQMGYTTKSANDKLDFVVNFDTMSASFTNLQPSKSHMLVASIKMNKTTKKSWRIWKIGDEGEPWSPEIRNLNRAHSVPVLKSNLQKAVRKRNKEEAVRTALELLALDRMELYRRLPIISIEDTSLIEKTSVIIWLMMAGERGPMLKKIAEFVVKYVISLCECATYFPNHFMETSQTHIDLIKTDHGADIASLKIRESYGGMKGDMTMLSNAVAFYNSTPTNVYPLVKNNFELPEELDFDHIVLPEAIDFHPCSWILKKLTEKTALDSGSLRTIIWVGDSAANVRKPWTLDRQKAMRKDNDYIKVSYHLRMIRSNIEKNRYKS